MPGRQGIERSNPETKKKAEKDSLLNGSRLNSPTVQPQHPMLSELERAFQIPNPPPPPPTTLYGDREQMTSVGVKGTG